MLKVTFSSPSVLAYSSGREEVSPLQAAQHSEVTMDQTHSSNVSIVTEQKNQKIEDCDAVITSLPQLVLKVRHADCLPILMYHPSGVIAAIHAGRKGTELGITENVLMHLQNDFGIQDSLEMWFGPAICKNCYQINRETDLHYDLAEKNTTQIRQIFSNTQAKIMYSNRCTAHENEHFFSYRKEGKGVPMNWSGITFLTEPLPQVQSSIL